MLNVLRLQASNPAALCSDCGGSDGVVSSPRRLRLRLPAPRRFASFTLFSVENVSSEPSVASQLTSTVGSPSQWALSHRHIPFLSLTACAAAVSATWLFLRCNSSPSGHQESCRVAGEANGHHEGRATRHHVAAVRLSRMEISDLTLELSDLGQEITQGFRSSTRAVRLAEERLRRLTNMKPIGGRPNGAQIGEPVLARTARGMREGIVKGRGVMQMLFALTRYSKMLLNYSTSHSRA